MFRVNDPVLQILKDGLRVLGTKARWVRGYWAADKAGESVGNTTNFRNANDSRACSWCAEGAYMKACGDLGLPEAKADEAIEIADVASKKLFKSDIMNVNDKSRKGNDQKPILNLEQVRKAMKLAIKTREAALKKEAVAC